MQQHHAVMKITTDSVLLGAWTDCTGAKSILDVGAGSGVISLMLAQRCQGDIIAIEPDPGSAEDLMFNVRESPWPGKVICYPVSFQRFLDHNTDNLPQFDLVVSNPPYFMKDLPSRDPGKALARHMITLTYEDLLTGVQAILKPEGRLSLIIPFRYKSYLIFLASEQKMYCNRMLEVKPRKRKTVSRVLLEFGKKKKHLKSHMLIIHDENGYTEEYKVLTRDYYLHF